MKIYTYNRKERAHTQTQARTRTACTALCLGHVLHHALEHALHALILLAALYQLFLLQSRTGMQRCNWAMSFQQMLHTYKTRSKGLVKKDT